MKITVTMEIPVEKLTGLQALLSGDLDAAAAVAPLAALEEPVITYTPVEPKPAGEGDTPGDSPEPKAAEPVQVTKSMIRARGLELTQAGKKAELEGVFKKFGAVKLRDLKEEDYAEAYRLLGEL